MNFKTIPKYRV